MTTTTQNMAPTPPTQPRLNQTLTLSNPENATTTMLRWERAGGGGFALPLSDFPSIPLCGATCFLALQQFPCLYVFFVGGLGKMGAPRGWYGEEERR